MEINQIKMVYFSPTGTTKKIASSIARGINLERIEFVDITKPQARQQHISTSENELLIVAVPVYMGRIPAILSNWLKSIHADHTPAVCVVVYGNRAYDNALLELKEMLTGCGCIPVAGAAFIGEHSFSGPDTPSSVGRPDCDDLEKALDFGGKIRDFMEKMKSAGSATGRLKVPGSFPYGGVTDLWHIDFIAVSNQCTQCSVCAEGCPVGAIDSHNSSIMDKDKCTLCCACIKNCPQSARSIKPGLMKDAAIRCMAFTERKEPEFFMEFNHDI